MRILVVTETDSCCGPMAAAFLNDYAQSIEAVSVGKTPARSMDIMAVEAMKECLIDLTNYTPKAIDEIDRNSFDVVYDCPDEPCPTNLDDCRRLRDFVKNETFLFFRKIIPTKNSKL